MPADTTRKVIIGCVVVAALGAVGAGLYYKFLKKEDTEDDLHFQVPPPPPAKDPEKAAEPQGASKRAPSLDELAEELVRGAQAAEGAVALEGEYETFAEIGLKCKAPEGWELVTEEGPTPQIAVVKLYEKGVSEEERMDPMAFGNHPNIMVMVEDTQEPLSSKEYKDKSKEMAIRSGQGMMQIVKDAAVSVGPFEYQLEGAQAIPDPMVGRIIQIKFLNLLAMRGSCGYAVQYIGKEDNFDKHLDFVLQWAATIRLTDLPTRAPSYLEYSHLDHQVQLRLPWQWGLHKLPSASAPDAVVAFKTLSEDPDLVTLYKASETHGSAKEHLTQRLAAASAASSDVVVDGDLAHTTFTTQSKVVLLCCSAEYALELRPNGREAAKPAQVLLDVLRSIQPAAVAKTALRYVNSHYRFSYEVTPECSLSEFKFGTTPVMYSPVQQPKDDGEANIPILKVYVNKEQESFADLKAVEAKLIESCDPSTPMRDTQVEAFGPQEWLTFTTSHMDGPFGPYGPREEYKSKVFICLRGDESIMLKWEIAANEWRRYERHLVQLMGTFVVSP